MSEEILTSTFVALRKRFLRIALRWLPSAEDAEDALQEAFVRLWPRADRLATPSDVEAMAAATIRHIGIDSHRQRQKVPIVHGLAEECGRQTAEADDLRDERERQLQAVERLIEQRLTPLQQDIVRRREYEAQSYADIATALGMQPAAVRMQLSRARKQIREAYRNTHTS